MSDREKAIKNAQVCVVKMNESKPRCMSKCSLMLSKPGYERKFGVSLDVIWHNRQSGSRHRGGMNTITGFIRNMGTCRPDVKREAQVETPRGESIDAEHSGGSARSCDEVSVMETERRG